MSEEQLNENYIRDKIKGICQDCIYLNKIIPIIQKMLSERYINGLKQGKFDIRMDLIKYLEDKIRELETKYKFGENLLADGYVQTFKDILERLKNNNYENSKN